MLESVYPIVLPAAATENLLVQHLLLPALQLSPSLVASTQVGQTANTYSISLAGDFINQEYTSQWLQCGPCQATLS